jgi:putative glutathione S-transferase
MTTSLDAVSVKGEFTRRPSVFRNTVSSAPDAQYPAEENRYVLYVSYACPWASRCLAAIALKGLGHVFRVVLVEPIWERTRPEQDEHRGWVIPAGADPVFNAKFIRDVYDAATPKDAEPTAVFSVPVFLDAKTKTIVNNESSEIIRFIGQEFNALAKHPNTDLYPAKHRAEIDRTSESFYNTVCNGVYRCGFAQSQEAYDVAVTELFEALDHLDEVLSKRRFLIEGTTTPTESDIRLFVTLIRFDEVYVVHFKANKKQIKEYEHLHGWLKHMWQWDGGVLQETVNMDHIKRHYYGSHKTLNPYGIIPAGPNALLALEGPHGRDKL